MIQEKIVPPFQFSKPSRQTNTEMKEYQTPPKGHGRPNASKLSNRLSKKTIPKKNLNAAFSSISEDVSDKLSVMESTPISVISELNEVNRESEISESLMILPDSALSSSAPSSGHASWNVAKSSEFDGSKFGSMEAEVIAGFLRQARTQVLDCAGLDAESKKILDALVEIVVEDFHAVREEKDQIAKLLSEKNKILIVCLLLWMIAMAAFLVFNAGAQSPFRGPLPT